MTENTKIWLKENRLDILVKGIAFLISPVLGFFAALPRLNTRSSFILMILASMVMGLAMDVPEYRTEEEDYDAIVYRQRFEDMTYYDSQDFSIIFQEYAEFDGATDFYDMLICYIVSRFTENYHIYFMVIFMIYAFFMMKALRYLVSDERFRFSIACVVLVFLFTASQIFYASVVRFFTAYWITVYALFRIFADNEKKAIWWLVVTPFVHASYFILLPVFGIYFLVRNKNTWAVAFVIVSFLFSTVAVKVFSFFILHLPESLGGHYSSYLNEWYIHEINESGTGLKWVVRLMELVVRLSVNALALFFAWRYNTDIRDSKCRSLYFLMMSFLAFVNFTFMIPSVGSRYVMFLFPLFAYIWLVCIDGEIRWRKYLYLFSSIYFFFFFVLPWSIYLLPSLRVYGTLWNADVLYQSPVYLVFKYLVAQ